MSKPNQGREARQKKSAKKHPFSGKNGSKTVFKKKRTVVKVTKTTSTTTEETSISKPDC